MKPEEQKEILFSQKEEELQQHALKLFHRLWGKDKENPLYDKEEWQSLQLVLNRLGVMV